jgi:predicted porin
MKKTLIALAAVAVSSAAMAQVTVSGAWGVAYQSFDTAAVAAKNGVVASGTPGTSGYVAATSGTAAVPAGESKGFSMTDADINFAVSEDLGNGLRASGSVSLSANNSRGGSVTKNDSSLALSGGFGTISVANTRSSNAAIAANVFAASTPVVSIYASTDSRAAGDAVTYTTPELVKGLRLSLTQFEATEGNVTSEEVNIVGATYSAGPLAVVLAVKDYSSALNTAGAEDRTEAAVTYDFGVARVGLGYGTKTTATDAATGAVTGHAGTYYGITVPMGAITIGANGGKRGDANYMDAGVKYALSKRSTINVMFGERDTGNGVDLSQYRIGLFHTF